MFDNKKEQDWPSLWWKKVDCICTEYVVYNKTVDLVNYDVQPNVVVIPIQALVARKMYNALHCYPLTWIYLQNITIHRLNNQGQEHKPNLIRNTIPHNNVNHLIFTGKAALTYNLAC